MQDDTIHNGLGVSRRELPLAATIEAASTGAHSAIESLASAAKPAVDRIAGQAHLVVDRLGEAAGSASALVGRRSDQLSEAGSRVTSRYRRHVTEHPLTAVGIAVAAGYLIARLTRR